MARDKSDSERRTQKIVECGAILREATYLIQWNKEMIDDKEKWGPENTRPVNDLFTEFLQGYQIRLLCTKKRDRSKDPTFCAFNRSSRGPGCSSLEDGMGTLWLCAIRWNYTYQWNLCNKWIINGRTCNQLDNKADYPRTLSRGGIYWYIGKFIDQGSRVRERTKICNPSSSRGKICPDNIQRMNTNDHRAKNHFLV